MKKIKIIIGIVGVFVLGFFVLAEINKKDTVKKDSSIRIGAVLSLSGPAVNDGEAIKEGFDLALADLRERGVNLEILYADDETNPQKTVSSIEFLKNKDVQVFAGFNWDFIYNSAIPVLDASRIVNIAPSNTSEYTSQKEYGFTAGPKTSFSRDLLAEFFQEQEIETISFLGSQYPWTEVHYDNLVEAAKEANVEIISVDWVQGGQESESVSTIIPKIKQVNPDMMFVMFGGDQAISGLFKRMQQNKLTIPLIAGTTSLGRFIQENPELLSADYPVYSLVPNSSVEFIEHFESKTDRVPAEYAEYAYDSILILVQALQENGEKGLKEYIENTSFQGFSREYSFDENHDSTNGLWQIRKDN